MTSKNEMKSCKRVVFFSPDDATENCRYRECVIDGTAKRKKDKKYR